ncbi:MAG: glycine cleavage system protein GcvH [Clostridia bacterium]|nr:glycine cleavage system protein GcvH [Clostridia bacterium]MBT7122119.1 glycine cleavage system protein GcvH [Clostridia bacterium]
MKTIDGLKYSKEHEWVRVEDDVAYIGITDYAQENLGDVVYVEFPGMGDTIVAGDVLSVVESVKAASDIYSPISGEVVQINEALNDDTEKINESPYDSWIAALKLTSPDELDTLMDEIEYQAFCDEEE